MLKSTNLSLPYIAPAQAQKHVTHNEAVRMLDSLVQMSVINQTDMPPSSPDDGARYIIGPNALEAWAGKSKYIAAYRDGAWAFYVPQNGWVVWDRQEEALYVFHDDDWQKIINDDLDLAPTQLGVNTSADGINRLAVKSDAVLFSHDDITPGNGDMRLVLNKAALGGTASVLYQTNYSGRAEFGLSGDDDLQLKVAANGQNWTEALRVNGQTGQVSLPQTVPVSAPFNLLKDSGRFAGSPDPQGATADAFTPPGYVSPYNGAVFEAGPQFIHNNATYGGTRGALDPIVDDLISRLKKAAMRRYGIEFHLMKITAGSGQAGVLNSTAGPHYLSVTNKTVPLSAQLAVNYHIRVESGSVAIGRAGRVYVDGAETQETATILTPATGWQQVTQLIDYAPDSFTGYHPVLMRVYAKSGTIYHIAAPVIMPGHIQTKPGLLHSIIPSLDAWR